MLDSLYEERLLSLMIFSACFINFCNAFSSVLGLSVGVIFTLVHLFSFSFSNVRTELDAADMHAELIEFAVQHFPQIRS